MSLDGACGDRDVSARPPDGQPERRTASKTSDSIAPQDPPETRSRQECYDALVSAHCAELDSFRPSRTAQSAVDRVEWQIPLNDGVVDRVGRGIIDERAKRFSPAERRIAEHLATTGSAVVSIRTGTAAVYVGSHDFDDDDITWPEGPEIPLHSEFPAMIEIRDTGGDRQRQQEIADKIFAALRSEGRWRAVYIDDMQKILDRYAPVE